MERVVLTAGRNPRHRRECRCGPGKRDWCASQSARASRPGWWAPGGGVGKVPEVAQRPPLHLIEQGAVVQILAAGHEPSFAPLAAAVNDGRPVQDCHTRSGGARIYDGRSAASPV